MKNSKQVTSRCADLTCEVCGEVIEAESAVEWKEKPAHFEQPAESVPTHRHCAFHTCTSGDGEIAP